MDRNTTQTTQQSQHNQQNAQPQQNQQNQQSQQSQQKSQTRQQGTQMSGSPAANESGQEGARSDQQRGIATSREDGRGQTGQNTQRSQGVPGTGLSRQNRGSTALQGGRGGYSDPFALMQRMQQDMDQLFDQFGFGRGLGSSLGLLADRDLFGSLGGGLSTQQQGEWAPQIEVFRRGDRIVVRADVPGVDKKDLNIEVDDGVLTLSGERRAQNDENGDGWYRSERSYGRFERSIPLPEGVDANQCQATFNDGVLEVTLPAPKGQERKAKRIEIR
jgi:HSP20 family protein